jgi:hypothetical protein
MRTYLPLFCLMFIVGCFSQSSTHETLPKTVVADEGPKAPVIQPQPTVSQPVWNAYSRSNDNSGNPGYRLIAEKSDFLVSSHVKRLGVDECHKIIAHPKNIPDLDIRTRSVKACKGLFKKIELLNPETRPAIVRRKTSRRRPPMTY